MPHPPLPSCQAPAPAAAGTASGNMAGMNLLMTYQTWLQNLKSRSPESILSIYLTYLLLGLIYLLLAKIKNIILLEL